MADRKSICAPEVVINFFFVFLGFGHRSCAESCGERNLFRVELLRSLCQLSAFGLVVWRHDSQRSLDGHHSARYQSARQWRPHEVNNLLCIRYKAWKFSSNWSKLVWNCPNFVQNWSKPMLVLATWWPSPGTVSIGKTVHRGAFCQFPFRWIYYYGSNKCFLSWQTKKFCS